MFVEIVSSCVPHLSIIVRDGRYATSLSVDSGYKYHLLLSNFCSIWSKSVHLYTLSSPLCSELLLFCLAFYRMDMKCHLVFLFLLLIACCQLLEP